MYSYTLAASSLAWPLVPFSAQPDSYSSVPVYAYILAATSSLARPWHTLSEQSGCVAAGASGLALAVEMMIQTPARVKDTVPVYDFTIEELG